MTVKKRVEIFGIEKHPITLEQLKEFVELAYRFGANGSEIPTYLAKWGSIGAKSVRVDIEEMI